MISSAADDTEHPRTVTIEEEILNYSSVVLVPPGEDFVVSFDPSAQELVLKPEPPLEQECMEALDLVPTWMRMDLLHKFRLLSADDRVMFADLIRGSPDERYRDEIGFVIAHSTPETLSDSNFFPGLLTHNAALIYGSDEALDYVNVVEKEDHTTLSYRQADGSFVELPRDDYYWFVVHPKLGDELPTYVDPDYDYTSDPPFDRNYGVAPPTGKYWREWFFEYNRTDKPLLLDMLKGKGTVLDAIKAINGWIDASMVFTSDNERPVQPVRIYVKGQGRCGEYQDMRSAAARAALIPVIATSNAAEDHVWNEFWDLTWHHWDGMIDNPLAYEKGWGKTLSSVWNSRGDGYAWSVTSRYSDTALFNVSVDDTSFKPVDGAEISIYTENFYQPEVRTVTFSAVTDSLGTATFELGDLRNYWGRADTSDLGSDPANPLTQNEVAMNATPGGEYQVHFRVPKSAPSLIVGASGHGTLPAEWDDPYFSMDFKVVGQITRGIASVAPGRYDLRKEGGNIDFFIADDVNMLAYQSGLPVTGWGFEERTNNQSTEYQVSSDSTWSYVLSNGFSQQTYKIIEVNAVVRTVIRLTIDTPEEGQMISVGAPVEVSGIVINGMDEVEVSMDDGVSWLPVEYSEGEHGSIIWHITVDVGSTPSVVLPVEVRALAKLKGNNESIVGTSFFMVDDLPPAITGSLDRTTVKRGGIVSLSGSAKDNFALGTVHCSIDPAGYEQDLDLDESSRFSMEISTDGFEAGAYKVSVKAEDLYGNAAMVNLSFEVIEADPPVLDIISPGPGSIHKHGSPIEVRGRVLDASPLGSLSLSLDDAGPMNVDTGAIDSQGYFTYSYSYSEGSIGPGSQELKLSAMDEVGNSATDSVVVILDGEGPMMGLDVPIMMTVAPRTDVSIRGTLSDDNGLDRVEAVVNGNKSFGAKLNLRSGAFSLEIAPAMGLLEGENIVALRGYDSAGWMTEKEISIIVDGTAPVITFDDVPLYIMKGEELNFIASIDEVNVVEEVLLYATGGSDVDITEDLEFGEVRVSLETAGMLTGMVDVTVRARDVAGNVGEASFQVNVITKDLDSDDDGIPDWWEYKHDLDPFRDDADEDLDDDGFTNLEEFLGDDGVWRDEDDSTDPRNPLSKPDTNGPKGQSALLYVLAIVVAVLAVIVLLVIMFAMGRNRSKDGVA